MIKIIVWPTTENVFRPEIAETIAESLIEKGHSVEISNQVDTYQKDCCHIILGINAIGRAPGELPPKESIIINMEQLYSNSMWLTDQYIDILKKYPIWDYNQSNIKWLKSNFGIEAKQMTLGYCSRLSIPKTLPEEIDVLFYGGLNQRRLWLRDRLTHLRSVFRGNDLWGDEKKELISRAKIVLNLHYYPVALFEYPRVIHLLNVGKFVITEKSSNDPEYQQLTPGLVRTDLSRIPSQIEFYLQNPSLRIEIAERGHLICRGISTELPTLEI